MCEERKFRIIPLAHRISLTSASSGPNEEATAARPRREGRYFLSEGHHSINSLPARNARAPLAEACTSSYGLCILFFFVKVCLAQKEVDINNQKKEKRNLCCTSAAQIKCNVCNVPHRSPSPPLLMRWPPAELWWGISTEYMIWRGIPKHASIFAQATRHRR